VRHSELLLAAAAEIRNLNLRAFSNQKLLQLACVTKGRSAKTKAATQRAGHSPLRGRRC